MENIKTAKDPETEKFLKQLQFISTSKPSDLASVRALKNSGNTSVSHAARKREHSLEKYALLLKTNPHARISKGKSKPDQCSRGRPGDARTQRS